MSTATLYINNLNEKLSVNKNKRELEKLFSKYGDIISLIVKKKVSLKGQLFVTFKDEQVSSKAQKELNGVSLFGNKINVNFAKENSIAFYKATLSEEEFNRFIETKSKKRRREEEQSTNQGVPSRKKIKLIKSDVPHHILLLQNLPSDITKERIVDIFAKNNGFIDVRLIKVRNLSFIEFADIESAKKVISTYSKGNIQELNGDNGEPSFITYAKK